MVAKLFNFILSSGVINYLKSALMWLLRVFIVMTAINFLLDFFTMDEVLSRKFFDEIFSMFKIIVRLALYFSAILILPYSLYLLWKIRKYCKKENVSFGELDEDILRKL
jgi:hypothetical protein